MKNSIDLISPAFLGNSALLAEVSRWAAVMARPNGWHYDLDIAWIMEQLEDAGIRPGRTVLDAGAGLGVPQYVLAARGYNVISLDFAERSAPLLARGIFDITVRENPSFSYWHDYMDHMVYEKKSGARRIERVGRHLRKAFNTRDWAFYGSRAKEAVRNKLANHRERRTDHSGFGKIEFVRASFHEIPLPDACCDAVVSVSAIEHADRKILPAAVRELRRIVVPEGPVLITTSATAGNNDVFHELTKGWCFCAATLSELFNGQADFSTYDRIERELLSSRLLWSRLHMLYRKKDGTGLFASGPVGKLPYLPVGIHVHGGACPA